MLRNYIENLKKWIVFSGLFLATGILQADAFTDFFRAVLRDDESGMVALTLRGFDLNTRNEKGDPALLIALKNDSLRVANFLLEQASLDVEARNAQGESPLMVAAIRGQLAQAKRLIERQAEVNKPGWTPLHYAASNAGERSVDMVRLLLEHHAYIDADSPNRSTPLMMAARYGHPNTVKLLLEEGADPLLRNEQGLTAIDFARRAERRESADLIAAFIRGKQPAGRW